MFVDILHVLVQEKAKKVHGAKSVDLMIPKTPIMAKGRPYIGVCLVKILGRTDR